MYRYENGINVLISLKSLQESEFSFCNLKVGHHSICAFILAGRAGQETSLEDVTTEPDNQVGV